MLAAVIGIDSFIKNITAVPLIAVWKDQVFHKVIVIPYWNSSHECGKSF